MIGKAFGIVVLVGCFSILSVFRPTATQEIDPFVQVIEANGSRNIRLRTEILVYLSDSGMSLSMDEPKLNYDKAINFLEEIFRRNPRHYDLIVKDRALGFDSISLFANLSKEMKFGKLT